MMKATRSMLQEVDRKCYEGGKGTIVLIENTPKKVGFQNGFIYTSSLAPVTLMMT